MRTRIEAFAEIVKDYGSPAAFHYSLPGRDLSKRAFRGKIVYIPRPCDHYLAIAEALKRGGIEAEALPPPDGESEYLARFHVSGRECYPFILFAGDLLRLTKRNNFSPGMSAFLVLGGGTSCRGSEFGRCMRKILADIDVEMPVLDFHVSFKENEFYDSFGQVIAREMWRGWVAIDYLLKLLHEVRAFESKDGETGEAYEKALAGVLKCLGTSDFPDAVAEGAAIIAKIAPLHERRARLKEKLIVGLTGEHFMTINPYANNNMAKALEAAGAVIFLPPHFNDYVLFSSDTRWRSELLKAPLKAPLLYLQAFMQSYDEKEIGSIFAPHLLNHPEPAPRDAIERASRYISSSIDPIAVLHVVKAQDFAMKGVDGLLNVMLNVMPLGCLLNYIPTLGAYDRIFADYGIPRCDLRMDGLCHTGERTRLEAFIDLLREKKGIN